MTEEQLRAIEARAAQGEASAEDALLLVAEVRVLWKLLADLRADTRSLLRVWGESQHQ